MYFSFKLFYMNKLFIVLLLVSNIVCAQKNNGRSSITNPADIAKMALAKQTLYSGNYAGALSSFREVENGNPTNENVKYYIGFCHYNLGQIEKAKEKLLESIALNNEAKNQSHLLLGIIYHYQGELTKAKESLKVYKSNSNLGEDELSEVNLHLAQCETAEGLISNPMNVNIENMGAEINSKYDDKNPCITADGKNLVFTTRRPENTNALIDVEGDGKFFENVFISHPDSLTQKFQKCAPIPGALNSPAHDACTSISPDGKLIYVYKNDVNDKDSRGGNIFVSKSTNGRWRKPESMGKPVNTSYWEGGACLSPDGKKLFFTSERPGGQGKSDIWMIEKIDKKVWGKPLNLGPEINSANDEGGLFLAPDGKTLFFCSNGPKSMGSYDIFKSVYEFGRWTTPVNVGYPINSVGREGQLTVSADAQYAYFSSDRLGGLGESDLYKIDLKDYAILEKDGTRKTSNGLCILKGTIREGFEGYGISEVELKVSDEKNNIIGSTATNEIGEYFLTLPGGKYTIHFKKTGYKDIQENINLEANSKQTNVFEKGYLMQK